MFKFLEVMLNKKMNLFKYLDINSQKIFCDDNKIKKKVTLRRATFIWM